MGFFNRLLGIDDTPRPQPVPTLDEALDEACNRHILAHIEQYNAETDPARALALMSPEHYERFAVLALDGVVAMLGAQLRNAWARAGGDGGGTALAELEIDDQALATLRDRLAICLDPLVAAMKGYAPLHARVAQMVAEAQRGAWRAGAEWGAAGAEIGESLFGAVGAFLGACAGGYFAGNAIEKQMAAEGERLDATFREMLGAYDAAMASLHELAVGVLTWYRGVLADATANRRPRG